MAIDVIENFFGKIKNGTIDDLCEVLNNGDTICLTLSMSTILGFILDSVEEKEKFEIFLYRKHRPN